MTTTLRPEPGRPFVCTACAARFADRVELDAHWDEHPDCRAALTNPAGTFGPPERER